MFKFLGSKKYYYIILPLVLFVIVPGFFVGQNINDLKELNSSVFILLLMFYFSMSVMFLLLAGKILSKFNKEEYFANLVKFSFYYVFLAGLFFPVTMSGLTTWKYYTPIDYPNVFFAVSLSVILFWLSRTKHKATLDVVIAVILSVNFLLAINSFVDLRNKEATHVKKLLQSSDDKSIFKVSPVPGNIFIFSLDAVPRNQFIEVVKNNEKYNNVLKDFTVFENVTGVFAATHGSITDELYGNQSIKGKAVTEVDFTNLNPEKLMTNHLDNNGYKVSTYGKYSLGFSDESRAFARGTLQSEINPITSLYKIFDTYDYIISRIFTSVSLRIKKYFITKVGFDNSLFKLIVDLVSADSPNIELYHKLALSPGITYEYTRGVDIIELAMYVDNLRISDDVVPTAHFIHNSITHFPVTVDKNCNYIAHEDGWYDSMMSPAGNMRGNLCAAEYITKFLNKLKELGVYDNSLIIIKSDHGRHQQFYDKKSIESFKLYNHESYGFNRYTPILLIKDYNKQAKEVSFNDNPVLLGDLAKTLCINSNANVNCEKYPGYNLLDKNLKIPETAKAYYHIVKPDRISGFKLEDTLEVELDRKKDFYSNINNKIIDEFIVTPANCNKEYSLSSGEVFQNGLTDNSTWAKWRDFGKVGLRVNLGGCKNDIPIVFSYDGDDTSGLIDGISITINGKKLSNTVEELGTRDGKHYYKALIKTNYLNDKENELIELGEKKARYSGHFEFVSLGKEGL